MHAAIRVGTGAGRFFLLAASLAALIVPGPVSAGPSPPPLNGKPAPGAPVPAQALRQFTTTEPVIALTFDAGSDRGGAERVLDVARERGIRLTFGMTGTWASQNPDLLRRMVAERHQLINHTWDHLSWTGYSTPDQPTARTAAARAAELSRTDDFVFAQTGMHLSPYFRAPYGDYDDGVLADLAANGYRYNVLWTQGLDTLGWQGASVAQITTTVLDHAVPGAIVLMHVGAASRDADALAGIIERLRERG
jgi:peptidoglycan/xylan/chitin deacetylase (PgdA/CDA1 family)